MTEERRQQYLDPLRELASRSMAQQRGRDDGRPIVHIVDRTAQEARHRAVQGTKGRLDAHQDVIPRWGEARSQADQPSCGSVGCRAIAGQQGRSQRVDAPAGPSDGARVIPAGQTRPEQRAQTARDGPIAGLRPGDSPPTTPPVGGPGRPTVGTCEPR